MKSYEHLSLPVYRGNVERKTREKVVIKYNFPKGRDKATYSQKASQKANEIISSFVALKSNFSGRITPSLIYEIEINQSISPEGFEKTLASMGIHVLSVAENKKGYWIVFS